MSQENPEMPADNDSPDSGAKHVPVAEAIKYRRRAQQAEGQLQQYTMQIEELKGRIDGKSEELATAEAQRDEAASRLTAAENQLAVERMLGAAGVVDLEAASTLLGKRLDLAENLDQETIATGVEQLLLDKPFLRRSPGPLPPTTASANLSRTAVAGQLATAAQRAAQTGDRKDVAAYLRLRRQAAIC